MSSGGARNARIITSAVGPEIHSILNYTVAHIDETKKNRRQKMMYADTLYVVTSQTITMNVNWLSLAGAVLLMLAAVFVFVAITNDR